MKAVFIARTGALVEGHDERFTLRCGAGAGLRQLAELDFRLVVIENGAVPPALQAPAFSAPAFGAPVPGSAIHGQPDHALPSFWPQPLSAGTSAPETCTHRRRRGDRWYRSELAPGLYPEPRSELDLERSLPAATAIDEEIAFDLGHDHDHERHTSHMPTRARGDCIADRLDDLLFREQVPLQGFYACSHGTEGAASSLAQDRARGGGSAFDRAPWPLRQGERMAPPHRCSCAPPQPGLLLQAAFEEGVELANSWLIGATLDMVEAGNRAGCRTMLLDNGTEVAWRLGRGRVPTRIAPDLHAAAMLIKAEGVRKRPW